ncbi:MAG TPA: GNAT family N-acetyltransferase [Parafilimonas sp.]|nr:GNAT family N-acetyltransferase [Parafilimonas sp.]
MQHFEFWPLPQINTQRLLLRQLLIKDTEEIFALRINEEVNKFIGRRVPDSLDDAKEFIRSINEGIAQKQTCYWAIVLKENAKLIGTITLWQFSNEDNSAELGYELHPDFQHKGFMQEAISAVIQFAFKDLQFKKLYAWTHRNNIASINLLKKNNFKRDEIAERKNAGAAILKNMVIYFLDSAND